MTSLSKYQGRPLSYFLGLVTGAALMFAGMSAMKPAPAQVDVGETDTHFSLINPRLSCASSKALVGLRLTQLDQDLSAFIKQAEARHPGFRYTAYVRDLNDGAWFGVGEDEQLFPGSLIKLPLAIGSMKTSEADPNVLNKLIQMTPADIKFYEVQGIAPSTRLVAGRKYTVNELIRTSLVESGNASSRALEVADQHRSIRKRQREAPKFYSFDTGVERALSREIKPIARRYVRIWTCL